MISVDNYPIFYKVCENASKYSFLYFYNLITKFKSSKINSSKTNMSKIANDSMPNPDKSKGIKMVMGTIDDVMRMGSIIIKDIRDRKTYANKFQNMEEKVKFFQEKYSDFGKTFPITLKHMITTEIYYKDVFNKFVKLCQAKPTHSMDEFQDRQAEYLTMIYRNEHPRSGGKEIAKVRSMYISQLKKEEQHMKKIMESVKDDREKKQSKYNDVKKSEILEFIRKYKNEIPDDVEVTLSPQKREQINTRENAINMSAPHPIVNELTKDDVVGLFGNKEENNENNENNENKENNTESNVTVDDIDEEDDA